MTDDQLEQLGQMVDRMDNFSHASLIPMPAEIHAKCLSAAMAEMRDELRTLLIGNGFNPWDEMQHDHARARLSTVREGGDYG